jgi:hypothetical protein
VLAAIILLSLACAVPAMPASSLPTLPPGGINTIVALTAGAAQMQTAAALPPASLTPPPTFTPTNTVIPPTDTPTPTETVIFHFFIPTSTKPPTSSTGSSTSGTAAEYACKLVSQSPANNTKLAPATAFDVSWKVKNTGNKVLDKASTDFVFKGGTNMSAINGYDFPGDVPVNGTIVLTVSMTSPAAPGTYTSTWAVQRGKTDVCTVSIKIIVQ